MSSLKRKSAEDEAVVGRVVEGPTDLTGGPMGMMLRDYEKKIEEFEEQIKNHVEEMAKKDKEIEVTKMQLQEMNQRFTQQTVQVQEKNIEIMKLQAELGKKDEMIAQQGVEIAEKTKMSDDMDITRDSHEGDENLKQLQEKYDELQKNRNFWENCSNRRLEIIQRQKEELKGFNKSAGDKSLVQQLNDALNDAAVKGRALENKNQRIAELEKALAVASNHSPTTTTPPTSLINPLFTAAPTPAPAPPACVPDQTQEIISKWEAKVEQVRKVAREQIGQREAKIKDLQYENLKKARELQNQRVALEKCEKTIEGLEDEIQEQKKTIAELEVDNKGLASTTKAANGELQRQIEEYQARIAELNESFASEKRKLESDFGLKKGQYEGKLSALQGSTVPRDVYDAQASELDDAAAEVGRLRQLIGESQHHCGAKDTEIAEFRAQIEHLNAFCAWSEAARLESQDKLSRTRRDALDYIAKLKYIVRAFRIQRNCLGLPLPKELQPKGWPLPKGS